MDVFFCYCSSLSHFRAHNDRKLQKKKKEKEKERQKVGGNERKKEILYKIIERVALCHLSMHFSWTTPFEEKLGHSCNSKLIVLSVIIGTGPRNNEKFF